MMGSFPASLAISSMVEKPSQSLGLPKFVASPSHTFFRFGTVAVSTSPRIFFMFDATIVGDVLFTT